MADFPNVNTTANNVNYQPQQNIQQKNTADNKPSDDKKMKNSTKLMIGATALAAAVVAGVMLHKTSVVKKAASEAEALNRERGAVKEILSHHASEEEVAAKIEEISKLPLEEQKVAYANMKKLTWNIIELKRVQERDIMDEVILRRGMKGVPKDVQEEMKKGNWIQAGQLYEAHVQELPNAFKAKNIGATVEESISNVFGADSKVTPHTYDLEKEGEEIISLRYCNGYYDVLATKEGILYEPGETSIFRSRGNVDGFKNTANHAPIKDGAKIIHGVNKDGKYVTLLEMPDPKQADNSGKSTTIALGLISKDKKMTQAQKDFLSLTEHPEKFDVSLIDRLTEKTNSDVKGAVNMDYDLALSVIQSMAKG